jgi:radical SAM superfamily enzyme YgiQ (UPF0313 family)
LDLPRLLGSRDYFAVASGGLVGDYWFFEALFREVKALAPGMPCLIGGGITRDLNPKVLFEHVPVDFAVVGEAELTLPPLIQALRGAPELLQGLRGILRRGEDGTVIRHPGQRRLDLMTERVFPSHTFFDHRT